MKYSINQAYVHEFLETSRLGTCTNAEGWQHLVLLSVRALASLNVIPGRPQYALCCVLPLWGQRLNSYAFRQLFITVYVLSHAKILNS